MAKELLSLDNGTTCSSWNYSSTRLATGSTDGTFQIFNFRDPPSSSSNSLRSSFKSKVTFIFNSIIIVFFLLRACLGAYAISDWLSCLSKQGLSGSSLCFSQWFLHLCFSPWNCEGSWWKHPEDSLASSRVWWCSCMYFHWWNCFIVGRDRGRYHWFGFFIYLSCFTFFSFIFPLKVHSFSLVLFSQCWKSNF